MRQVKIPSWLQKLLVFPAFLLIACLTAGLYGIIHNQISYTVAPSYFHEFKFQQFNIPLEEHTRMTASKIGFFASWFMGLLISVPVYLTAALTLKGKRFYLVLLKSIFIVILTTLIVGLCALLYAYLTLSPADLPNWTNRRNLTQPLEFARAGTMHNFSYLGGLIGIATSIIFILGNWHQGRS